MMICMAKQPTISYERRLLRPTQRFGLIVAEEMPSALRTDTSNAG